MKGRDSSAFERVVSRSLYSKKVVLATALAIIMVGSAFVVSVPTKAGGSSTNITVEGWNLWPGVPDWSTGNLKGYVEGDVVPVRLTIPNPNPDVLVPPNQVTVKIGFDHCYGPSFDSPLYYGYEMVVPYKWDGNNPSAPYVAGSGSGSGYVSPFYVKLSEGSIVSVTHNSNPADSSTYLREGYEWVDVWTVVVQFGGIGDIHLKTGGLLAMSTLGKNGASFYPGSKLHFGLVEDGKRTVSCNVEGMVLTPPHMLMEKSVSPETYINGETITFVMHMENTGQADASIIKIVDWLPLVSKVPLVYLLQYKPGSTMVWTSFASTPVFWKNPDIDSFDMKMRLTWDGYPIHDAGCNPVHPGTSHDYLGDQLFYLASGTPIAPPAAPPIVSLSFQVKVIDPGLRFYRYENTARVWYDDSHSLEDLVAEDSCYFWIIEPKIDITKESFKWPYCEKEPIPMPCAAGPYESGYQDNSEGQGDWIAYRITLHNSGDVPLDFYVSDPDLAPYVLPPVLSPSDWIWTGSLACDQTLSKVFKYVVKGTETEIQVSPGVYAFRNTALVVAKDANERHAISNTATCDVEILHPSVKITKTADRDTAMPGEYVYFTITIQNPDPDDPNDWPADTGLYVNVYDMLLKPYVGSIDPMAHPDLKALFGDNIPAGTTKTYTSAEVAALKWQVPQDWVGVPEIKTNTAILYGHDTQEHKIKRSTSKDIDLVNPDATITKKAVTGDGSTVAKTSVGTDRIVWYYIKVDNPVRAYGNTEIWFEYVDSLIGGTWSPDAPLHDSTHLAIGASDQNWHKYTVPLNPDAAWKSAHIENGKLKNTVTVRIWWHNPALFPDQYMTRTQTCYVDLYGTITGIVFKDTGEGGGIAYNGIKDGTEVGLGSQTGPPPGSITYYFVVNLFHYEGLTKVIDKTTVSSDGPSPAIGKFSFDEIIPAVNYYWIEEIPITTLDWFVITVLESNPRQISSVDFLTTVDEEFANAQYGRITGFKWLDKDHDGSFDEGYLAGLDGWTIKLWGTKFDGTVIPEGSPITTTTHTELLLLDPSNPLSGYVLKPGFYHFDGSVPGLAPGLVPGQYRVAEVVKPGWHAITHSMLPWPSGWLDLDSAEIISCQNFGNAPCIKLWGYKFFDKDMDGVWDHPDEPALDGFTMRLMEQDKDGKWTVMVAEATTDLNGKFVFTDVHPGQYLLVEYFPAGFKYGTGDDWYMTNADVLNPPGLTREAKQIDELADVETPNQNPGVKTDDIGDMRYAKIKGYLFKDLPGLGGAWPLGQYDHPLEQGIVVTSKVIKLDGYTSEAFPVHVAKESRTYADHEGPLPREPWNGWYRFDKLKPGTYTVESLWQEIHWLHTTPVKYTLVVPAYYMGDAPVVFAEINFGYMQTCADPWWPFELQKGWNLWSTPMVVDGLKASTLLQAIGANAVIVTKLNTVTGVYDSFRPKYPNELDFPIVLGEGYYIYVKATTSFALVGEFVDSNPMALAPGWNIVGPDQMGAMTAADLLGMVQGCNAKLVTYLDPETQTYHSYRLSYPDELNFAVIPGGAYFLYVDATGTLV